MAIIKTVEDFQKYVNVTGTLKIDSIQPFIEDAQNAYLREFLDETLLGELDEFVVSATIPEWDDFTEEEATAAITKLLPYVQCALAKFSLYIASPFLDLKVTDSGFAVVQNTNLAPASTDRVKRFTDATLKAGYDNIETLLRFLEKYKANYPSWVAGKGYTLATRYFINSAEEFNKHVNIDNSRLKFRQLMTTMEDVEILQVEPVISTELADVIRNSVRDGDTSENNLKILLYLRKAIANLTYYQAGISPDKMPAGSNVSVELAKLENYQRMGNHYMAEVKKVIDANPDNYPEYKDSAIYDSTKTSYNLFENSADNPSFVFGG